jgi:pyridoxine kinase
MKEKSVLVISDISCVGKCSLTVALPVISALGIEVSVLPTAILSTQTGGFNNYYFKDLSEELIKIIKHLKTINLKFDCIYIGYLGNIKQIDLAIEIINIFKAENGFIVVDPVMADSGKLYEHFDNQYPKHIIKLCQIADYIFPNLTESLLLTKETSFSNKTKTILKDICLNYAITSVVKDDKINTVCYDNSIKKEFTVSHDIIEGTYHGAGDLFASAVIACMLYGLSFENSIIKANAFCYKSILDTKNSKRDTKYGLLFEKNIYDFITSVYHI